MSHLFKLMRENVSEAPLESSKEAEAITEELEVRVFSLQYRFMNEPYIGIIKDWRIKKEEVFFYKLLSSVAAINKTSTTNIESDLAMWDLLRQKGTELKEEDFDLGAAICKTVQACIVVETQRQKSIESSTASMESKLQKWARDDVKSARALADNYAKLHRAYTNSVVKVNQVNRDKKVQLSELAVAEKKRDDLFQEWEKEGRVGVQALQHIFDNSKATLMFALSEYIQARLEAHNNAVATLSKIQQHLNELTHYATEQAAIQKKSVNQLQTTIHNEELRQRAIDNQPRSLHPSLMSAAAATSLYASKSTLNCFWDAKRENRKTTIAFDVRTAALTIGDVSWHVDDILALTKGHKNDSTKVKLNFVNREYKDENLSFYSTKDREAFYEMFCFLRRGFANSFVASTQTPVTHEEVKIWTGSWNMGDAPPEFHNEAAMENWMPRNKFDFYVVGLQESEYTPRSGYLTAEDDVFSFIRLHLGDNYLKLAGASLQHIRIVCFVCRDHYHKISQVKTATVATGLAGVIGNKGCSAISFSFYDARFCFIGSHLAARIDRKRLEARNQNYRDILKGLASGFSTNGLSDIHHEFDYLFWLGDLNYRIDGLSRDDIISKAGIGDIRTLLKHDQLTNERAVENCFLEFSEPDITFGPTYRFNRGDRTWSEEKMREPAYCDRVLYKTLPAAVVRPLSYQPCHDLMTSDHSPISSTFAVAIYLPAMPHVRDPVCKVTLKDIVGIDLPRASNDKSSAGRFSIVVQAPWITNQIQVNAADTTVNGSVPSGNASTSNSSSSSSTGTSVSAANANNSAFTTTTASASWPSEIELFPIATNKSYLSSRWIRLLVKEGKLDVGVGVIYLEDAITHSNRLIKWSANIVDKGHYTGRLTGSMFITFSPTYEDVWAYDPEPKILPSYYDLTPAARTILDHRPSRATLSESDFHSKQSVHVIEGGSVSSDANGTTGAAGTSQNPHHSLTDSKSSTTSSSSNSSTTSGVPINNPNNDREKMSASTGSILSFKEVKTFSSFEFLDHFTGK